MQVWAQFRAALFNSIVTSLASTIVCVAISAFGGYAFTRLKFPGRQVMFIAVVATLAIPGYAVLIPLYRLMIGLHMVDTVIGITLIYVSAFLPLSLWLLRSVFESLPLSLEEAAQLDGAGRLYIFFRIILPLAGPGLTAAAILTFLGAWGQYVVPLIFSPTATKPLTVLIPEFTTKILHRLWADHRERFDRHRRPGAGGHFPQPLPGERAAGRSGQVTRPTNTENFMGLTEQTIFEQFPYWRTAIAPVPPPKAAPVTVFVGCGTSYNLALSLAALANASGRAAIGVPGGEWVTSPQNYWSAWQTAHVVALSRSGETTETVAAAKASRAAGAYVTAITVERGSALAANCDRLLAAETHPAEGIVMTSSASLMLLLGIELLGHPVPPSAGRRRARASRQCRRQAALADRRPVALRLPRRRSSLWRRARGRSQADGDEPGVHAGLPSARISPWADQPRRPSHGGGDALQRRPAGGRGEARG